MISRTDKIILLAIAMLAFCMLACGNLSPRTPMGEGAIQFVEEHK